MLPTIQQASGLARTVVKRAGMAIGRRVADRIAQRLGTQVLSRLATLSPLLGELLGHQEQPSAPGHMSMQRAAAAAEALDADVLPAQLAPQPRADALFGQVRALEGGLRWQDRAEAAEGLAGSPQPHAQAALVEALRDPAVEVAVASALSLGKCADPAARLALLTTLEDRDRCHHPLVRAAAATALGPVQRGAQADEALAALLDAVRDRDAEVSLAAISVLAEGDCEGTGERLLGLLEEASGYYLPLTRLAAARALGRLSTLEHPRLQRLHDTEQDFEVRGVLATLLSH